MQPGLIVSIVELKFDIRSGPEQIIKFNCIIVELKSVGIDYASMRDWAVNYLY